MPHIVYRVAFSLVGGSHQFLHGLPVAASLSRRPDITVEVFTPCQSDADVARDMLHALGAEQVAITVMALPTIISRPSKRLSASGPLKILRLAWWGNRMRQFDCIVALERTSTWLTRVPGHCPPIVHIPHGVGGPRRASGKGVDRRFSLFDLALVAGPADVRCTVEHGLLPPERVFAVGQVKLAGLNRLRKLACQRLFANERPTILYNPHFHPRRGSWARFGEELIRTVKKDGNFNLIVAPHVRLFADRPCAERRALEALSDAEWLIVDLGSERCMNMTYTLGADIYVGDFSSQLYEWLIFPRPCVFIDQVADAGSGDTKLPTMWSLGEKVTTPEQVLDSLHRATADHELYKARQLEAIRDAVGDFCSPADENAAERIIEFLGERSPSSGNG